jgi:hypothetical protein
MHPQEPAGEQLPLLQLLGLLSQLQLSLLPPIEGSSLELWDQLS